LLLNLLSSVPKLLTDFSKPETRSKMFPNFCNLLSTLVSVWQIVSSCAVILSDMFDCYSRSSSLGTLRGLLQGCFPSGEQMSLSELKLPLAFVFHLLLWAINQIFGHKIENFRPKYTRVKSCTSLLAHGRSQTSLFHQCLFYIANY